MEIGIFGPSNDQEVVALQKRLINRGAKATIYDLAKYPYDMDISITSDGVFIDGSNILDLNAAFLRGRGINIPDEFSYVHDAPLPENEKWNHLYTSFISYSANEQAHQRVRNSVLEIFAKNRPLVSPLQKNDLHRLKTYLFWSIKNKVPVPNSVVGSDKQKMHNFAKEDNEDFDGTVQKPLAGIYKTYLWEEEQADLHNWTGRPALFQKYIKGDTIRCYVLNYKLIAAAQIVHKGTVDSSLSQTGIKVLNLPKHAQKICEDTAKELGLQFCGMDLMKRENTEDYYLIDCNISPMFVNFAHQSLIDIPSKIAEYLIDLAQPYTNTKSKETPFLEDAKQLLASDPDILKLLKRD